MKNSDLDLDIPSIESLRIRERLPKASIKNQKGDLQPHASGVYFYKNLPTFEGMSVIDYKQMEQADFQKIDILNNTFLDDITVESFSEFIEKINSEDIDWKSLWDYENPYQLSNYPAILREFKVSSVLDVAIVLAIIRPGAIQQYDKLKKNIHTDALLKNKTNEFYDLLKDTYGIPVFDDQFKKMGFDDGKYRYKKPHAIGYAYVLLVDFLKNSLK